MPSLLSILRQLLKAETSDSGPQGSRAMIEQGVVVSVRGDGKLYVQAEKQTVLAKPVHDEPLAPQDRVWVQESSEGYVVIGGDHG